MTNFPNIEMDGIDPKRAIDLRWTLRDIKAERTKLSPLDSEHVQTLIEMGLVEIHNDTPTLTDAGRGAIA